ncbi:MAG: hypothetical protein JWM90_1590 [Thermoleophilia bacterium]|nr:hypothetical protein [Thermoleophilia bacterium]
MDGRFAGDILAMRIDLVSGALDSAFDGPSGTGTGIATYPQAATAEWGQDIVGGPEGSNIYLAGHMTLGGVGQEPVPLRINPGTGALDAAFDGDSGASDGVVRVTLHPPPTIRSLA